jgi:hypothetical protein
MNPIFSLSYDLEETASIFVVHGTIMPAFRPEEIAVLRMSFKALNTLALHRASRYVDDILVTQQVIRI